MSRRNHILDTGDLNTRLARAIRARRVLLGKSQEQVGKDIGVTFQQIQKYEGAHNQLTVVRAAEIAHALGWDVTQLLTAALGEPAERDDVSDRATLEFVKRFGVLKPHERQGVVLLVQKLAEAA